MGRLCFQLSDPHSAGGNEGCGGALKRMLDNFDNENDDHSLH